MGCPRGRPAGHPHPLPNAPHLKGFDKLLTDVRKLETGLRHPVRFFAEKQDTYHATAAAIARRVIIGMRPPETDAAEWARRAEVVISRIVSELMLGGGLAISVEDAANAAPAPQPGGNPANPTRDDIVEWIRAGLRGEAGGKRITDADRERIARHGERAVATIVRRAVYSDRNSPSYHRLRRAIHSYLSGAGDAVADDMLRAVLTAWEVHFSVRASRDLAAYVADVARKF
jgi:hypothetical protein